MPKRKGGPTKKAKSQKNHRKHVGTTSGGGRKSTLNGQTSKKGTVADESQGHSRPRHAKMTMLQELRFTDRHRIQDFSRNLRHGQISFVKASQNYDPSQFINEYLRKKSLGEDASLAGLVSGEPDPVSSLKLSSAAASSEDNAELSIENESGTDQNEALESPGSNDYDEDDDTMDKLTVVSSQSSHKSRLTPELVSEYGKSGIADDERGESDTESERHFYSMSHSVSNEDDSEDVDNHSSDVNYDELIGLKNLALRDLEGGSDVNFGSSSSETDDELALDEEDTYDSDEVDFSTEYESVLNEISEIKSINRTIAGPDGRVFTLSLAGNDEDVSVTESQLYGYFKRHRGLSRSEMTKSITELGGDVEEDSDDFEFDVDGDESNSDAYDDGSDFNDEGQQYDKAMEQLLDNSNLKDEELDSIIQALIQGDPDALSQQQPQSSSSKKRSKKAPHFDLSDDELQDYLNLQWQRSREAKRLKRREREQLHQKGLLKGPKGDIGHHHIDLRREYLEKMHINEIVAEFQKFLLSPFAQQMIFPPMDNHGRWTIKELAKAFKVSAVSQEGRGTQKHVVITKNASSNLSNVDSVVVSKIQNRRRMFPRADLSKAVAKGKESAIRKSRQSGGTKHHREGDVVGGEASEIGIDNVGRQLLEKMGWKAGMGLGTTTIGILEPISAIVKRTKWGLGKEEP
jgi:G-patch domain/R3H domain